MTGNADDNTFYGNEGKDRLFGGDGKDILNGGSGNDILNGGSGSDVFQFSQGIATVKNFDVANDKLDVRGGNSELSFANLQEVAAAVTGLTSGNLRIEQGGVVMIIEGFTFEELSVFNFLFA
ncbi:MAG: serralysin [Paracoccaceae bacterium]|jgi:serralysin